MFKYALAVMFAVLVVCGNLVAQTPPPGCTWEGDPAFRLGWGATYASWPSYIPPPGNYHGHGAPGNAGKDTTWCVPGAALAFKVGPYNAAASWLPTEYCKGADTLCFEIRDNLGWTIACNPVVGTPFALSGGGYLWTQNVTINVPCSATIGSYDEVIAIVTYTNTSAVCDTSCGDCADPNTRPADGYYYYSKDTLYVRVDPPQVLPPPVILQDTLTIVERGQSNAYIPFSICDDDPCYDMDVGYHIWSLGHIGPAISVYDTVHVEAGKCKDVYGTVNAALNLACTYDTLHIIAWSCASTPVYDTCVQVVHIIELCCLPLFTAPVVVALVFLLILAAALFMRRRAASKT